MISFALALLAQSSNDAKVQTRQDLDRAYAIGVLGDYDGDHVGDYAVAGCVRVDGVRQLRVRVFSGRDDRELVELATPVAPLDSFVLHEAQFTPLVDFNEDGIVELAATGGNGWLLNGRTGKALHDFGLGSRILGVLGDVDGDKSVDLLVDTYLDPATVKNGGTFVRHAWSAATSKEIEGSEIARAGDFALIDDVDGDGRRDFARIQNDFDAWLQVSSGADGHELKRIAWPRNERRLRSVRGFADGPVPDSLLVLGATDSVGPSNEDAFGQTAFALVSLTKGERLFAREYDFEPADNEYGGCGGFRAAVLDDIDDDGVRDFALALPSYQFTGPSFVAAFSGADGSLLWRCAKVTAEALNASVDVLSDRDGDGIAELLVSVAGEEHGVVGVVSGRTGELLKQFAP